MIRHPQTRRQFLWTTAASVTSLASLRGHYRQPEPTGPAIRCAVVGVGMRGREILRMLARIEQASVTGYCDPYPPYLRRGARLAPDARSFEDADQMLAEASEIQAVFVCTPTHLHRQVVESALKAGKHVYCEAPLASTVEDCRAIAKAASASERTFAMGLQNRANPLFKHASKFIRARYLGRLMTEEGHWYENNSWRRAVSDPAFQKAFDWKLDPEVSLGLLGEAGVHTFDNSLRFQGSYPVAVSAFGSLMKWDDGRVLPDTVFCIFEYPNGLLSRFEATLTNSFREKYYLLNGGDGSILLKDAHSWWFKEVNAPSVGWEVYASREKIGNEEGIVLRANATKILQQGKLPAKEGGESGQLEDDPLYVALQEFLAAAAKGEATGWGAKEGYESAVMAIQAHQALAAGKRLEIDSSVFRL